MIKVAVSLNGEVAEPLSIIAHRSKVGNTVTLESYFVGRILRKTIGTEIEGSNSETNVRDSRPSIHWRKNSCKGDNQAFQKG